MVDQHVREQVRERYAAAAVAVSSTGSNPLALVEADQCCVPSDVVSENASCCGGGGAVDAAFGSTLYSAGEQDELPAEAVLASLGCGNPVAVADLHEGERVLDLALARANAGRTGATNVEFLKGTIEAIPLPADSIDVVISNCVINLSTDKPAVLAEMFRVLAPGGRIGISDVVAEDHLSVAERTERGSYVGCIAGALSRAEYLGGLAAVGFTDAEVSFTHEAAPGMHGAIVRAVKPAQASCCEPSAQAACCSGEHPAGSCGCP